MTEPTQQETTDIYATLAAPINEFTVQKVFNSITIAMNNRVKNVHVLVQSAGGFVGDGVVLYNFLKNLPINIIAYNGGSVQSAAVIAFLGAKVRKVSKTAIFMIHRASYSGGIPASSVELKAQADSLVIDDARIEVILRERIKMPDADWDVHNNANLFLTAEKSVEYGIATEIGDFCPPLGATIFNIVNS